MKYTVLFLSLLMLTFGLMGQSLDAQLANELAQKAYDAHRPDSAQIYAKKALDLSLKEANTNQQWKAIIHLGYYAEIQGNYGNALDKYVDALQLADEEKELLVSYDKIGIVYGMANEFGQSIENLNKALGHAHFPEDKIMVLNDLGKVYAKQDKFEKSRNYFLDALALVEEKGDIKGKINSYAYLGQLASREGKYNEAISYYRKVLNLTSLLGTIDMRPYNVMILGQQYHLLHKYDSAQYYYNQALKITRKTNKPIVEGYVLTNMAENYLAQSKLDSALYCIKRVDSLSTVWKVPGQTLDVLRIMAEIYTKQGLTNKAELYQFKLKNLEDSIKKTVEEAKVKEAEQKFSEKVEPETNTNYRSLSIVVVVLVASLLTFVFIRRNVSGDDETKPSSKSVSNINSKTDLDTLAPVVNESKIEFLHLISHNGEKPMRLEKIIYIEKEGKLCEAYTDEGTFKLRKTLAELEIELPSKQFFRINRSVIIQLDKMLNYSYWEHDKYIVRMKEGDKKEFVMSRDRLKFLQQALGMNV